MLCPVECLPSVACRGLASLSIMPANPWGESKFRGSDPWVEDFFLHMNHTVKEEDRQGSALPTDPRHWSRAEVAQWVELVSRTHRLPPVQPDRFPMNGKALCLMSMDMFVSRVPLGGKLLYKDFRLRLSSALYGC